MVGLGKMGLSHLAIVGAHPEINLVAACDTVGYLTDVLNKHAGLKCYADYDRMLAEEQLDALVISTPSKLHAAMVDKALQRGLHVFCEKPLTLSVEQSAELVDLARSQGVHAQVGYHNRFVAAFAEAKRLLDLGAIGEVRHAQAEAYGPVVLQNKGGTWRSRRAEGGGCLYDYAAHPINLMNWYVGEPSQCGGAELAKQYSVDVEDAVYANLRFPSGVTGQVTVNWSDETIRKMSTQISIWGDGGKIVVDRQELQIYIGATGKTQPGYGEGWTVRYITELTPNVDYYLRGEEYTAQLEGFAVAVQERKLDCVNDFKSAAETDRTLEMIRARALMDLPEAVLAANAPSAPRSRGVLARVLGR